MNKQIFDNKCIIYDCDGVIVDSESIAAREDARFLNRLGCPLDNEGCLKEFIGKSAEHIQEILRESFSIGLSSDDMQQIQLAILKQFEIDLRPLINQTLSHFHQSKVAQCIGSNSRRHWIAKSLEFTQQNKYFVENSIFARDDVQHSKPHPEIFLLAAEKMGYSPKNCVVVEDSPAGIEAAICAQIPVIAFLGGSHAQYRWYREQIQSFSIPMADTEEQLLALLKKMIS